MKMGMGMPIPDLSNLPGSSRPGGGGGTPPGPPSLPKIDNLYSFEFDGVGTYISVGHIDALNNQSSFSTSAWFKCATVSGAPIIINGGSSASNRFYIQLLTTGTTIRYVMGSDVKNTTVSNVADGNWHHVVTIHDGTSLDVYLDGTKEGTFTTVSPNTNIGTSFTIGKYVLGSSNYFNGYLDEIGVFNTALTQEQIESIYNATTTGKTADLSSLSPVAWYRMGD